jgi:hypothetical protein
MRLRWKRRAAFRSRSGTIRRPEDIAAALAIATNALLERTASVQDRGLALRFLERAEEDVRHWLQAADATIEIEASRRR